MPYALETQARDGNFDGDLNGFLNTLPTTTPVLNVAFTVAFDKYMACTVYPTLDHRLNRSIENAKSLSRSPLISCPKMNTRK